MAASTSSFGKTVAVTGASGYVASVLVAHLLERGYTVHGTVRSLTRPDKVDHLKSLPGAAENLKLFEADLLTAGTFDAAFVGVDAVFHTASPFFNAKSSDPEKELFAPAKQGTLNVLESAKKAGVKAVIVTSSIAAVWYKDHEEGHVWSGADWSDLDFLKEREWYYPMSKTMAERAAWDFHEANGEPFKLAVVNPSLVTGPMLQPNLSESSLIFSKYVTDTEPTFPFDSGMCFVDVRDVALAHILAYETGKAWGTKASALSTGQGRILTVHSEISIKQAVDAFTKGLPADLAAKVPKYDGEITVKTSTFNTSPAQEMGITWITAEQSVEDFARDPVFLAAVAKVNAEKSAQVTVSEKQVSFAFVCLAASLGCCA